MQQGMRRGGGGITTTPLTKRLLTALLGIYILQQILENWVGLPVMASLGWRPFNGGFQPWQPFTAFFLNGDVLRAFFDWLFLFFILPAVESMFSRTRLRQFAMVTYGGSILFGFFLLMVGAVHVNGVWFGIEPFLAGLLVLFGLSRPNATILLFFVIPIRAAWVAWGSGLLCLLYLLSGRDLGSAMWAAGWLSGYLWLRGGIVQGLRRPFLRWKQQQIKRRLNRFDVIEGGRGWGESNDDDIVH